MKPKFTTIGSMFRPYFRPWHALAARRAAVWLGSTVLVLALLPLSLVAQVRLINGDFDSGSVQAGAAVLGAAGDVWNSLGGTTSTTVGGVGLTLSSQGIYSDAGGTAMDAATTPLMEDYAYGYTSPSSVTVTITGLAAFTNNAFTLVIYVAGDTSGQGVTLSMTGEAGGNSGSDLTTSATTRQISQGIGNAYNTFTGTVTSGTLTFTANLNSRQSSLIA